MQSKNKIQNSQQQQNGQQRLNTVLDFTGYIIQNRMG